MVQTHRIGHWAGDVRVAFRRLARARIFAGVSIALATVGIAGGTACFILVNSAVFKGRELPGRSVRLASTLWVEDLDFVLPDRLVRPVRQNPPSSLESLFGYGASNGAAVRIGGTRNDAVVTRVFGHYFDTFDVRPVAGRLLGVADDAAGSAPVAVVSEQFWEVKLGRRPDIVGDVAYVGGRAVTIVGIVEEQFEGFGRRLSSDIWTTSMGIPVEHIYGRLRPGVSFEAARSEIESLYRVAGDQQTPPHALTLKRGVPPQLLPSRALFWLAVATITGGLALAVVGVSLVVIFGARLSRYAPEMSLRLALGASHTAAAAPWLAEVAIICAVSAPLGAHLARMIADDLAARFFVQSAGFTGTALNFAPDWRVYLWVAILTAIVLWAALALALNRVRMVAAGVSSVLARELSGGGGHDAGFRRRLVTAQVAATTCLLLLSLLVAVSIENVPTASRPAATRTVIAWLDQSGPDYEAVQRSNRLALAAVEADPAFVHAGLATRLFRHSAMSSTTDYGVSKSVNPVGVTEGFLGAMHIPILKGRGLTTAEDRMNAAVVVLSGTAATELFGEASPIGRSLVLRLLEKSWTLTVVGVAADVDYPQRPSPRPRVAYVSYAFAQSLWRQGETVLAATGGAPLPELLRSLSASVERREPQIVLTRPGTLEQEVARSTGPRRIVSDMLALVGRLGFLLSLLSFYGVSAELASQRRREIGIRIALGAAPIRLAAPLVAEATGVVAKGVLLGGALALVTGVFWRARSFTQLDVFAFAVYLEVFSTVGAAAAIGQFLPYAALFRRTPSVLLRD